MKRLDIDWNVHTTTDFEAALMRFRLYLEDNSFRKSTIEGYVGNDSQYLKFAGTDKPSDKDRMPTLQIRRRGRGTRCIWCCKTSSH